MFLQQDLLQKTSTIVWRFGLIKKIFDEIQIFSNHLIRIENLPLMKGTLKT